MRSDLEHFKISVLTCLEEAKFTNEIIANRYTIANYMQRGKNGGTE